MGGILRKSVALGLLAVLVWSGCDRMGGSPGAEEREANYIAGQNFRIQHQLDKAIDSFEQAVLVNPSSAAAHLALADLFFQRSAFINSAYHYNRHQQLLERRGQKPDSTVAGRLEACELQLALKYSQQLSRQQTDTELEVLRRQLAEKDSTIQRLQAELLLRPALGPSGIGTSGGTQPTAPQANGLTNPVPSNPTVPTSGQGTTRSGESNPGTTPERPRAPTPRSHVVRSGETPAAIARKYGVSTRALLAANPGLSPTRMKVGTVLRIPTP
ncbi:MAG TPA: hypothetical protein DCE44_26325 [Verrucomicrobiales bacterium]|nr:hypothetical protein [Verrucomicrobiales bacterium]